MPKGFELALALASGATAPPGPLVPPHSAAALLSQDLLSASFPLPPRFIHTFLLQLLVGVAGR